MTELGDFLRAHERDHVHVRRPVPLDYVGALTAQADGPIVFHEIEGYPGYELVDQLFVNRRSQAAVLGCGDDEVVRTLAQVLQCGPQALHMTSDAACQARVVTGDDIDLGALPIVTHTDLDPYPYTTCFAVHRDPDTGIQNEMFPRCGVLSRDEMVTSFVTPTALRFHRRHAELGTPMPQAVVIGSHPAWELAATFSYQHAGWSELELFEAITGRAGAVARCHSIDLTVPADASIVIEGLVHPTRTADDGPSPGPTMVFVPYVTKQPVFQVTAITFADELIYRNHQMTPFTDHQQFPRLFNEAIVFDRLVSMGIGVRDVLFTQAGGGLTVVIQVEPTTDGQVTDALLCVLGMPWSHMKMAIAVDPDIDIYDNRDLMYALAARVDPSRDVKHIDGGRGFIFDPSATPVTAASPDALDTRFPSVVGKWGIDATKPVPYRQARRRSFERAWPAHWGEVDLDDYRATDDETRG